MHAKRDTARQISKCYSSSELFVGLLRDAHAPWHLRSLGCLLFFLTQYREREVLQGWHQMNPTESKYMSRTATLSCPIQVRMRIWLIKGKVLWGITSGCDRAPQLSRIPTPRQSPPSTSTRLIKNPCRKFNMHHPFGDSFPEFSFGRSWRSLCLLGFCSR